MSGSGSATPQTVDVAQTVEVAVTVTSHWVSVASWVVNTTTVLVRGGRDNWLGPQVPNARASGVTVGNHTEVEVTVTCATGATTDDDAAMAEVISVTVPRGAQHTGMLSSQSFDQYGVLFPWHSSTVARQTPGPVTSGLQLSGVQPAARTDGRAMMPTERMKEAFMMVLFL